MSYTTITTDVTIDYDDISDDDLLDMIEYKLSLYKTKKTPKYYEEFKSSIKDCLEYDTAGEPVEEKGTIEDWLKDKVLYKLSKKYSLEQLEGFLNDN